MTKVVPKRNEHMTEVLEPYKIIKSKRQPKNLKLLRWAKYADVEDNPKYYDVIAQNVDGVYI